MSRHQPEDRARMGEEGMPPTNMVHTATIAHVSGGRRQEVVEEGRGDTRHEDRLEN